MTSEEVARPRRLSATAMDMVRSFGLLAVVIAVTLIFVPGLLHPSHKQRYPAASYGDDVTGFHQVTSEQAWVPSNAPTGWHANAASLTHKKSIAHLHIGWVTPGEQYAGLEESNAAPAGFIRVVLGKKGAKATGTTTIAGTRWDTRMSSRGEYSLTRTTDGVTIVITGSASATQQRELAESLRRS